MWIVQLALRRPYTFIVAALLLLIVSPLVILRTPTDIFPNINIPVVSIVWQYSEGITRGAIRTSRRPSLELPPRVSKRVRVPPGDVSGHSSKSGTVSPYVKVIFERTLRMTG